MAQVGDTAPTLSGDLELLCHFADANACGLKEPCWNGSPWEAFCAARKPAPFRGSGASRSTGPLQMLPSATDGGALPSATDGSSNASTNDNLVSLPMPSLTVHHFTLERDIPDIAVRCLHSWAHGHRQIVWHYFEEAFHQAAPAVPLCDWRHGDLVLPQRQFDAITDKHGARAARLALVAVWRRASAVHIVTWTSSGWGPGCRRLAVVSCLLMQIPRYWCLSGLGRQTTALARRRPGDCRLFQLTARKPCWLLQVSASARQFK